MLALMLTCDMREIDFYETAFGKIPGVDFLDSIPGKSAQKVTWVLQLIEELKFVPSQYLKKLKNTDDIWEVRIIYSGDIYRLLGFFESEEKLIITNGFCKKTQKTPLNEIKLAEKRKKDFFNRKNYE